MTPSQPLEIVPYAEPWLGELLPLWRASFEAALGITDPHPLEAQAAHFLRAVLPHNEVRLALAGGRLLGFVAASSASVDQLYVRPGAQRQGVGRVLLGWAKQQSGGRLRLYTFEKNLGARAFYERQGFVAVQRGFEPFWQLEDILYEWSAGTGPLA